MLDFYTSFSIIVILTVLSLVGCIIFFLIKIILIFYDKGKRKKIEKNIQEIADMIIFTKENKNIENTEELLKQIKIPRYIKITEDDNELIIKYKNLIYNVNKGRFIVDR